MSKKITKELFDSFQKGEEKALAVIIDAYTVRLFSFVRKSVHSQAVIEEIVQDSFIALWKQRKHIQSHETILAYLFRVCYNLSADYVRSQIKERACLELHRYHTVSFSDFCCPLSLDDLEKQVSWVLKKMPARRRRVFELSRVEGLTCEEIASLLNISVKTVYSHIDHALVEFRSILLR